MRNVRTGDGEDRGEMPVAPYKSTVLLWSECDGDLVDLLCDEAVVVEDDAVRGLGSLLHQTNNIVTIYLPASVSVSV